MLKDMKKHMIAKLDTIDGPSQLEYLSYSTYQGPRFKSKVNFDIQDFKEKVKTICEDTANIPEFNKYFTGAQAEEYANL